MMNEWQPIETVPIQTKVLILFKNSGHVEDAYFSPCEDGEGVYYTLFDGETMNDFPTHWMPFLEPPK